MKNRNTINPKTKTSLRLRKILLFSAGAVVVGGIIWKVFFATVATVANPNDVLAMFTPATGPQLSGHSYESTLMVNQAMVADIVNLEDFPLLVSFTNPDFKSVSNGGNVASNEGYDILFCGANDAKLDHQLEKYDPTTGEVVAWVRLPVLYHDYSTELKITCGNPNIASDQSTENVWSSDYEAVWHMNDDLSAGDLIDAAGTYDGEPHNMNSADLVDGAIGGATDFDGNDYIAIRNKHYSQQGEITEMVVSAWVKTNFYHSGWTKNWSILDFDRSEYFNFFVHGQGHASFCTRQFNEGINDFHGGVQGQVNDGEWHYIAGVFDGTRKYIYIDGVMVDSTSVSPSIGLGNIRYGFIGDGSEATVFNGTRNNYGYEGMIDELRLQHRTRSRGWIETEFNNQSDPEGYITFGNTVTNLPIELVMFNAQLADNTVLLDWLTVSERDNDYFTLERSANGKDFEEIGQVKGAGTTSEPQEYSYTDQNPLAGLSYYRLRQTDYNGEYEIFNAVAIKYEVALASVTIDRVWPNPFVNDFEMTYTVDAEATLKITLTNSNGMIVYTDLLEAQTGENTFKFYPSDELQPGIYFISLISDEEVKATQKIIKR